MKCCDYEETRKATFAAGEHEGPVYLRFGRCNLPVVTSPETPFEIGKAQIFRDGTDVTIIACGILVHEALMAAELLMGEGISARVVNCPSIKPLDVATIMQCANETGCIVTAEEHQIYGGLGGAVAEALAANRPTPLEFVGVKDSFGESGDAMELLRIYGLTRDSIAAAAKRAIARK